MKLYISRCKTCNNKIYLGVQARNRMDLKYRIGDTFSIQCPTCHTINIYSPNDVYAETSSNSALGGGVVGGLVGLLGGPIGLLIGGAIGGALGNENDKTDKDNVNRFNSSHCHQIQ